MNRALTILITALLASNLAAQQMPVMGGYNVDPFHLSPAYAGLQNPNSLFLDHRSDFSGIAGGPKTYMLSYHNRIQDKMGVGGRMLYDKTDIFTQLMVTATYSYEVAISEGHLLNFALSAGIYNNSINLDKYYDDPDYVDDPVLANNTERSRMKFTTDFSALYRYSSLEAGVWFSGIMFGDAVYDNEDLVYNPAMNYQLHAAWNFNIDERWNVKPYLLLRGTENAPLQGELLGHVGYTDRLWANLMFRTGGIWGAGVGGVIYRGISLNYAYNFSHKMPSNTFSGHIVTLGFNLSALAAN